ncbi:MAG: hypothetical protein BWY65_00192 [Firmicutes bacterium ADurb.Bin373]|nr:hypothetical protein [Bacillota bacterium]OQA11102.1 MAG: hypothetical protein BWY65_00192 [Firmicutes bacterium ADurb.Bin373]
MSSSSRKKEKINPEFLTPPLEDEDNLCSEEMSCPKSCVSEDDENSSC